MISAELRALFERLRHAERRMFFPGTLPDRNALDEAQRRTVTTAWGARVPEYYAVKAHHQSNLVLLGRRYRFEQPRSKVLVACNWKEPDRRRDPDNIVGGGRKLLLDALKPPKAGKRTSNGLGLLHCDGWHCIAGFVDIVTLDVEAPGVEVTLAEVQLELPLSRSAREVRVDLREAST